MYNLNGSYLRSHETVEAIMNTYKLMYRKQADILIKEGLTRPKFLALWAIADNGSAPLNKISEKMVATPSNITGIIDRLESHHLLKRGGKEDDRRKTIIQLTEKGTEVFKDVTAKYFQFIKKALTSLNQEGREELKRLLVKLTSAMNEVEP